MLVAVASAMSGTGKTTVAVGVALALLGQPFSSGRRLAFLDLDTTAPSAALLLRPRISQREEARVPLASLDRERCVRSGHCIAACARHALTVVNGRVTLFQDLCDGCGSCLLVCPSGALTEAPQAVGLVERGRVGSMQFVQARCDGDAVAATETILHARRALPSADDALVLMDTPPGVAAPAVAALRGSQYALIVTGAGKEGALNLERTAALLCALRIPFGVVLNRVDEGESDISRRCEEAGWPILARLAPLGDTLEDETASLSLLVSAQGTFESLAQRVVAGVRP